VVDIVDVMGAALVGAAVALLLVACLSLAALVKLLAPAGGLSHMPVPSTGVPAHADAVALQIRTHVRNRMGLPTESARHRPEPMRLRLMLGGRYRALPRRAAA
jgi:hypothetical protein